MSKQEMNFVSVSSIATIDDKEYLRFLHGLPREVAPLIRDRMFYTGVAESTNVFLLIFFLL
jgi:hypothetical protein